MRIDRDLDARLKEVARERGVSVNVLLSVALRNYLDRLVPLEEDPDRVLAIVKQNLELMRRTDHGAHSRPYLDASQMLVEGPRRDLSNRSLN